jgi:beta-galactosidase
MKKILWNEDWKFWTGGDPFALLRGVPEHAKNVVLPHDAMIENKVFDRSMNGVNSGFRDGDVYHYTKKLFAPEEFKDKTVTLHFEGIYMNAMIVVNGELAGKCPYGYTGFYVNLDDYLRYGAENEIHVIAKNQNMPNSRWYSGGGIYRDVYLLTADTVYIEPDSVQVITKTLQNGYANLEIHASVCNRRYNTVKIQLTTEINDDSKITVAKDVLPIILFAGETRKITQHIMVEAPKTWSTDSPVVYTCDSFLKEEGKLLDENHTTFGIRTLSVDAKNGFMVNGRTEKLRGACIHHDNGLLGAVTYYEAEYRRIKKLKEAGFNAIRMSHNPAGRLLLQACDYLGMYVMDESFDMWNRNKTENDYGNVFDEWWEHDITAMVQKDFNHPSVILYSIGNEIAEIGTAHGARISHNLCKKIKALDPTRFVLNSINGIYMAGDSMGKIMGDVMKELASKGEIKGNVNNFMSVMHSHMDKIVAHEEISKKLELACGDLDVAGYNYMASRYEPDGISYPNRVIVGSETYPPDIAKNWELVQRHNHVIGDFTWTGWDYIGEAGIGIQKYKSTEDKPCCQLAYIGDIDITGFRRPVSYYREIVFELRKKPYIAVEHPKYFSEEKQRNPWSFTDGISTWTFPGYENQTVRVEVYSSADEVELYCNGTSFGRKNAGKKVEYKTCFEVPYVSGELKAVSYINNKKVEEVALQTAKTDTQIKLIPETFAKEGKLEKAFIYIDILHCDSDENVITSQDTLLECNVDGPADILGFGSANPYSSYDYHGVKTETYQGRALLILRKRDTSAPVVVKVKSNTLEKAIWL